MLHNIKFVFICISSFVLDVQTTEAHEGKSHQTYGDESDAETLQGLGHIGVSHLLADGSQTYDGQ